MRIDLEVVMATNTNQMMLNVGGHLRYLDLDLDLITV